MLRHFLIGSTLILGMTVSAAAEETCRLSWGSCKNRVVCPEGTHSAGHKCYPTFTGYTYWLFGAPMPTGKKCGCAPPPIPYVGRKFDDEGRPISDETQSKIDKIMKAVDMEAVRNYYAAIDQVQGLLYQDSRGDDSSEVRFEDVEGTNCTE